MRILHGTEFHLVRDPIWQPRRRRRMDSVRCTCPRDSYGARRDRNPACAIHGVAGDTPLIDWTLTREDRAFLRTNKIDPEDSAAIQQVRQADEDRWKRD